MTSKSARMSTSRLQHIKDHLLDEYTCAEMAAPYSPLTTHVLNTGMGVPGAHMALSLHRMDPSTSLWNLLTTGTTNDDGRCPGLITRETFTPAVYKMRFETGQYWGSLGETSFYPYVESSP
ncbi:5-hydroxyisourate hydrolase isoform X2 [Oncorhynchus mykiss]|uniref:5-hydroxyisourate hydrolase isoform X2 n=1 Tax=Oncorhynchus mykiss TaxID=8022 RepID=UPI001878629A|nr:5-hydroxyisourate hydrolase isoform X2 [Oncorhynchus mykiss]